MVTITWRKEDVDEALGLHRNLTDSLIPAAMKSVITKARKQLPATAGEAYSLDSNAPEKPESSSIVKIQKFIAGSQPYSSIRYKTGKTGLDHYTHYFSNEVYAEVHKGSAHTVRGAFTPSGYANSRYAGLIFKRTGKAPVKPGKGRYLGKMKKDGSPLLREPIDRLYSVPVGVMFRHGKVATAFSSLSDDILSSHIAAAIKRGDKVYNKSVKAEARQARRAARAKAPKVVNAQ
ncbi:MAG: hypothetical protein LBB94_03820 [Clostridiales bacterium]|jgi:hypothetical protein|nr:hypothetical protein [Clostridiales bacterium]